jgi:hypothetical protein
VNRNCQIQFLRIGFFVFSARTNISIFVSSMHGIVFAAMHKHGVPIVKTVALLAPLA